MKTISAKYDWLKESHFRLDASYHLSEGRVAKALIDNCPYGITTLKSCTNDIFYGGRAKRIYVDNKEHGIPFMGISDMLKTDFSSLKYVSKKHTKNLKSSFLQIGWTLVSRSGTIGNTVFVNENFNGKAASEHIIRVVPNENIESGYLYAFLSSKYGFSLLTQGTFGAVIQHIEPDFMASLPIPLLPKEKQQQIHDLIIEASKLRVEANKLLVNAVCELENQFSIPKKEYFYKVSIKKIVGGDKYTKEARLEADFYEPSVENITSQIKSNTEFKLLGDVCESVTISNLRARKFVKKGIILFTGQSLGLLKPDLSKQLSHKFTANIEENTTIDGDVLISAFGTLGKVEYCYENFYIGIFASQQIVRLRPNNKKIHPGYLYIFFKTQIGQKQILKYKTGSVIEWANWNNFSSIPIPIPMDKGEEIGLKANKMANLHQSAYIKETQAIELIENEISSWQK